MEPIKYNGGYVLVRKIKGDGHCLFAAIVCQFHGTQETDAGHIQRIMELRNQVVVYIRSHMEDFRMSLEDTIRDNRYPGADTEEQIDNFLERLATTNEWGGQESISAAAHILQRKIELYYENGPVISFNREAVVFGVIKIAYRLAVRKSRNRVRNHYDWVLHRLSMPRSSSAASGTLEQPVTQVTRMQDNMGLNDSLVGLDPERLTNEAEADESWRTQWIFASWNVRGCTEEEKRNDMDLFFFQKGYQIIGLQETRMIQCSIQTENFWWFNVNNEEVRSRMGGGTAIMVSKKLFKEGMFRRISDDSCSYMLEVFGEKVVFLSCYVRSEASVESGEFHKIRNFLLTLPAALARNVVIVGDFNAHIGIRDRTDQDKGIFGNNLHHDICNANGLGLKSLLHGFRLKDQLTFSTSPSVRVTWSKGRSMSQIDHVLMSRMEFMKLPRVKAFFDGELRSDHKMVVCVCLKKDQQGMPPVSRSQQRPDKRKSQDQVRAAKKPRFDLERLKDDEEREKYQTQVDRLLAINSVADEHCVEENWKRVEASVMGAAKATLKTQGSPPTPRREQAHKQHFIAQQRVLADRNNRSLRAEARKAAKEKRNAYKAHFADKVDKFLEDIKNESSLAQMNLTFRFVKMHKRMGENKNRTFISIRKWEEKLASNTSAEQGDQLNLLPEDDGRSPGQEPSLEEVRQILWATRNKGAPGLDGMRNEFLKYGSEALLEELTKLLKEVFRTNQIPSSWNTTLQVPIPKAFDNVDTSKAIPILQDLGASKALINRILKACLRESTSVQWFGQRTTTRKKSRGIKQGCPISPDIFILILHHVLTTLKDLWPELQLGQGHNIKLPCILGYADDLLVILDKEEDVEKLLDLIIPLLASIGLELNTKKTKVLYRDPYDTNNTAPDTMKKFGKYELAVVTTLKYLGAYITSSLTRGSTTSERINKAYKAFHHLCSFLTEHKLKWEVVKKLYHCLITPVATYGMEVSTILKRNRNSLRRMENSMLLILRDLSLEDGSEPESNKAAAAEVDTVEPVANGFLEEEEDLLDLESGRGRSESLHTAGEAEEGRAGSGRSRDESERVPSGESQSEGGADGEHEGVASNNPHIAPNWLDNRTINNKIRSARFNFLAHVIRSPEGGILKAALEYKIPLPKKRGRPAYTVRNNMFSDIERSKIPLGVIHEAAMDKNKMKALTKSLFINMVESEYEVSSEDSDEDSDGSLLSSDFAGFSDENGPDVFDD
ncbi:hypothetical protein pipiens_007547 [Culex pipiens pipiens]|uniref:Reverse transcriptase domain-containing protein n=1 Tax=Culex pipiens pipiens TaxID=38569 RepID=A0ABD1DPJ3_CULPP